MEPTSETAVTDGQPESRPVLFQVDKVKKDYQMGEVTVSALREVTLQVYEGEFLVVLGPSGSGKSTLLNIIGGIDQATTGTVLFRDQALSEYTEGQLTLYRRHHIGFVFQFYNLMPNLTAEENVEMATEISSDPLSATEVLELVGLHERRTHFPSQLSGGEQQRVAIARAVAKQPEILLCDEPTGALDISTGKVVLDALQAINARMNTTVIVITHNAAIGAMAHRVIRMKDGHVEKIIVNERQQTVDELEW
ncbi:MAG: ABC transporter ATP-binding protein [bacterium]|nr:ABC transporter ATP-binding protein [bacterium]